MTFFVSTVDDLSETCWGGQVDAENLAVAMEIALDQLRKQLRPGVPPIVRVIGIVEMPRTPGADSFAAMVLMAMGSRHHEIIANRRAGG